MEGRLTLGVDTCGPAGSVALGRLEGEQLEILEQIELEGRSYSAKLVAVVGALLAHAGAKVGELGAIAAVNGPGSFTGMRVGLSAVKGLAEAASIPVVAVSRLEVLARKAGVASAALDAHRHEVFLRVGGPEETAREMLAGAVELAGVSACGRRVGVCDDAAEALLLSAWPDAEVIRTSAPDASDALRFSLPRLRAREFVDLALLDGHYLRRSDAEIFGEAAKVAGA
jgi:tRNA threonylcarbamoyladenosine biosynthesis protein TsaB